VEIDVERWALVRRIPAGEGVYNLAPTHDGRLLIATNKGGPLGLGLRHGERQRAGEDPHG
jgi:hypothetical protein